MRATSAKGMQIVFTGGMNDRHVGQKNQSCLFSDISFSSLDQCQNDNVVMEERR